LTKDKKRKRWKLWKQNYIIKREGERQAERKKVRQRETERQKDRDREIIIIRNKVNRVSVGLILIPYEANPFESD
jgi:hypothetical protein